VVTDRIIYRPGQDIQLKVRAYDDKLVETNRYRVAARLRMPGEDESQPFDAASVVLAPQLAEKTYLGKLAAPPADRFTDQSGTTLHKIVLEVAAFDGEERVAGSRLELQVIDDPAEFRDPRPDPSALLRLAQATGGAVIRSGDELSSLLARHQEVSIRTVVSRRPLWDTPLLWLALLGFLTAEWVVRRLKGLA
jgi:hypothetical protein